MPDNQNNVKPHQGTERGSQVRDLLTDLAVKFEFLEDVSLSDINIVASKQDNNRFGGPPDPDAVDRYYQSLLQGALFPPLVAFSDPAFGLVLTDGVHRLEAYLRAGVETTGIYHVVAPEEVLRVVKHAINLGNGLPYSKKEQEQIALNMLDQGWTAEQAAKQSKLTVSAVTTANQYRKVLNTLIAAFPPRQIKEIDSYTKTDQKTLSRAGVSEVIRMVHNVAKRYNVHGDNLKDFVEDVRIVPSAKEKAGVVKAWEERLHGEEVEREKGKGGPEMPGQRKVTFDDQLARSAGAVRAACKGILEGNPTDISLARRQELVEVVIRTIATLYDVREFLGKDLPNGEAGA